MKTVLVTGDTGFIGSHLVPLLQAKKFRVIGLSKSHVGCDYETIDFDIASGVPEIEGIDYIIHLAADVTGSRSSHAINVDGTRNVLELGRTRGIKTFVYASTGGVYGFSNRILKETDAANPDNEYTRTKHEAEILCKNYSGDFNVAILRYFFPYGRSSESARLINRLVKKVREGLGVEVNAAGRPTINPVFIDDTVDATLRSLDTHGFEIFNIAGTEKVNILDIIRIIEAGAGRKASILYNGKEVGDMVADISKAKKILGFEPAVNIRDGIGLLMQ